MIITPKDILLSIVLLLVILGLYLRIFGNNTTELWWVRYSRIAICSLAATTIAGIVYAVVFEPGETTGNMFYKGLQTMSLFNFLALAVLGMMMLFRVVWEGFKQQWQTWSGWLAILITAALFGASAVQVMFFDSKQPFGHYLDEGLSNAFLLIMAVAVVGFAVGIVWQIVTHIRRGR